MEQRRRDGPGGAAVALLLLLAVAPSVSALPIVDPGLFVILGVRTCGGGGGYCLLGSDCTLDRDFAPDDSGHCEGLRAAFTPAAHFSCCKYVERSNATLPGEPAEVTTTEDPGAALTTTVLDETENVIDTEIRVQDASVGNETDSAGKDTLNVPTDPSTGPTTTAAPSPPIPLGPALGQTVVAVSEEYKVQGAPEEEEEAEVVAVAGGNKEAVMESPSCRSPGADVNPCWRSSFQDRRGTTLCSGTLLGVDAAVTTAVCANRLMEAGPSAVSLRVDDLALPVRDIAVHQDFRGDPGDPHDIAVVRLLLAGGSVAGGPVGAPSPSCIACLPPGGDQVAALGRTCYALAARLNGLGVETSAVCAGRVSASQGVHMKLSGCEVASLKSSLSVGETQVQAVKAREGAAMLCDGTLTGLASTHSGTYASLSQHLQWLAHTLAAPRTHSFH